MRGIPGFQAEASLEPAQGRYRATASFGVPGAAGGLSMQGLSMALGPRLGLGIDLFPPIRCCRYVPSSVVSYASSGREPVGGLPLHRRLLRFPAHPMPPARECSAVDGVTKPACKRRKNRTSRMEKGDAVAVPRPVGLAVAIEGERDNPNPRGGLKHELTKV